MNVESIKHTFNNFTDYCEIEDFVEENTTMTCTYLGDGLIALNGVTMCIHDAERKLLNLAEDNQRNNGEAHDAS